MSSPDKHPAGRDLVLALTRQLKREDEGYGWPAYVRANIQDRVQTAARGPKAVAEVGALLKLIAVLRGKHRSPKAASALTDILQSSPEARRVIALHWSGGGQQPKMGPDLLPVKTGRAPHIDARPEAKSQRASTFLPAGTDLRSAHLQRHKIRKKS